MEFQQEYISKKKDIEGILDLFKSKDFIITGLGASEPMNILAELHRISERGVKNCDITNCLPLGNYEHIKNDSYKDVLFVNSWFYGGQMRSAAKNGNQNTTHMPQRLHTAYKKRAYAFDNRRVVLLCTCSPMDAHGYLSLSLGCTYEREAIDNGAFVIAEVNPNMPRTFGDTTVHISEINAFMEVDTPAPTLPAPSFTDKDKIIGALIADLVEDGSTIQLGIGGIPNAVADALKSKKDLGIHTEMFTDGMVDLIECGAVNNSKKSINPLQSVATFAMGSQKLYDYLDNNPAVLMRHGNYTNDPAVIGENSKMISINTTLEVDMFGQCASEAIGPVQFSGSGGQADTAIGAQRSVGGKSIIALYSTANIKNSDGTRTAVSKIVHFLKAGSIVTLSRNDVDYVVTEYGVASLSGQPTRERVKRLIAIAHPDFREELQELATTNNII